MQLLCRRVAGEYKEKLRKNNLNLIIKNDVTPVMIQADEQHVESVDNLMNNINKYTHMAREYIDIIPKDSGAIITFKNVSGYTVYQAMSLRSVLSEETVPAKYRGQRTWTVYCRKSHEAREYLELTVDGDLLR